jgi:nucleotide-binding universal stress UspA family protein
MGAQVRDVVVVGVDSSESSKLALRWAQFMAHATGSGVEVVAAWQPYVASGSIGYGYGYPAVPDEWDAEGDANKSIAVTVDGVFGAHRPAGLEVLTRQGGATQVLLAASAGARMLVLGSRGHGGFAGMLLGSVSAACAEHAACPVLVIQGSTPPPPMI